MVKCDICGKDTFTKKCLSCGKNACVSHYYVMMGVCSECIEDEDIPKDYIESLLNSD